MPPSGPAEQAGLQLYDVIVAIDGTPVVGLSAKEAELRLRGEVGTIVRLRVRREGGEAELAIRRSPYRPYTPR